MTSRQVASFCPGDMRAEGGVDRVELEAGETVVKQ